MVQLARLMALQSCALLRLDSVFLAPCQDRTILGSQPFLAWEAAGIRQILRAPKASAGAAAVLGGGSTLEYPGVGPGLPLSCCHLVSWQVGDTGK